MAFRPTDFRRWGVWESTDEILDDGKKRLLDRRMKAVLLALFVALLMVGCEEADLSDPDVVEDNTADTVEWSKLQDRGGVIYLPNTDKPFSGFAKRVYENEQVEILAQFKDGYVARLKQWQKNGTPRWDVGYREGKVAKSDVPLEDLTFLTNIWFYYGLSTIWYKNGQKATEGTFNKDGELDGILTWWYENGQKNSEANYKDGRPDGLSNVWYEDGQKESELNWKDGWKEGLSTYWYKNGQKESELNWKDGWSLISAEVWKPNGEKCPITNLQGGNGVRVWYDDEGNKRKRYIYKDGM